MLESISLVDREAWDRLADDVYMSHGWLRVIEEAFLDPVEHRYFLVRAGGRLLGASVAHIHQPSGDVFTLDDSVFGRSKPIVSRLGLSVLPSLICGPLRAYGQHMIFDKDIDTGERRTVTSTLLNAMEREAEKRRVSMSFNNVMCHERELIEQLEHRGFGRTVNFPLNYLDICWKTPDEYHTFLSKRKLKREINKNRREGVEITSMDSIGADDERLHELLNENYQKYNGKPLPVKTNFIRLCKKYLGDEAMVYVAKKKGMIVGTIVMFHRNRVGYVTDVGVDHAATGNDFTYFNLSYYVPVTDAVISGIERIHYGTMMYSMKSDRGCRTTEIHLYHRPRNRLLRRFTVPLFAAHRAFKYRFIQRHYFQ